MVIRRVKKVWVATDGIYMQELPVLDSWIWQEEEGMIKKVQEHSDGEYYINLHTGILFAHLYDRNQVYLD